jgi:hypothetical protein
VGPVSANEGLTAVGATSSASGPVPVRSLPVPGHYDDGGAVRVAVPCTHWEMP